MTISLITDGMLCYKSTIPPATPRDPDGVLGLAPGAPCSVDIDAPALTPPASPTQVGAQGPSTPTTPCAVSASDPTITPPGTPVGQEASEDLGTEAPAVPQCPEGEEV